MSHSRSRLPRFRVLEIKSHERWIANRSDGLISHRNRCEEAFCFEFRGEKRRKNDDPERGGGCRPISWIRNYQTQSIFGWMEWHRGEYTTRTMCPLKITPSSIDAHRWKGSRGNWNFKALKVIFRVSPFERIRSWIEVAGNESSLSLSNFFFSNGEMVWKENSDTREFRASRPWKSFPFPSSSRLPEQRRSKRWRSVSLITLSMAKVRDSSTNFPPNPLPSRKFPSRSEEKKETYLSRCCW